MHDQLRAQDSHGAHRRAGFVDGRDWRHVARATHAGMHPLIETLRAELLALARRRGVTAVRVFGWKSHGDASNASDVDLLVTLAPGTSALALGGLPPDGRTC
jgi:hypothetical protein